jgi:hypothetical protein
MSKHILGTCVLKDVDAEVGGEQNVDVGIERDNLALLIHPNGFGTWHGDYAPILLERYKGRLRLIVWSNAKNQEPTHIIDLNKARLPPARRTTAQ